MFTKTIKQGNSIMVTVPKSFNIPSGVMLDVKKVENGILYTFVQEEYDFFDFSTEILKDIIKEGVQWRTNCPRIYTKKTKD